MGNRQCRDEQVGASNELPESEELDALYDRFLIRRRVSQVRTTCFVPHAPGAVRQRQASFAPLLPTHLAPKLISLGVPAAVRQRLCLLSASLLLLGRRGALPHSEPAGPMHPVRSPMWWLRLCYLPWRRSARRACPRC